jgi:hypothetical protein
LADDELQTCIPVVSFPSFAEIRGNGHFHACGDAIRSVDRGEGLPPGRVRARWGKSPAT